MCKKVVVSQNLNQLAGGRILEIKTGLSKETSANAERCPLFCERAQGRILGVCNRRAREVIAVFSPKANAKGVENA